MAESNRNAALLNGAFIAVGALAIIDNVVAHWLLGLPVSYTLCFVLGWGVYGLWVGLSLGLIVTGITLLWVWTVRLEHYRQDPKTLRP